MSQDHISKIAVELWSARIPGLGRFAEHHWLVITKDAVADRWEVWQTQGQCKSSWAYLHRNLMHPSSGVGNGPGRMIHCWKDDDAGYQGDCTGNHGLKTTFSM